MFYKLMGALVALVILGSLYRTQFLDLTLLGILLSLVLLEEINQRYLRVFTYIFAVMLIGDFVWLCLFTGVRMNWSGIELGIERGGRREETGEVRDRNQLLGIPGEDPVHGAAVEAVDRARRIRLLLEGNLIIQRFLRKNSLN